MATKRQRFTISATSAMKAALDAVKREQYYRKTQGEMLRDLIILGRKVCEEKGTEEQD